MSATPIFDALKQYSEINKAYFRIPGHRFERGIPSAFTDFAGSSIFRLDITETPMSDDLHNPQSVIAESQAIAAKAFGAGKTFFLVNGTTSGNEAMILGTVKEGGKIIVPRNAHKSVLAGLIFSGAVPVYVEPDLIRGFGFAGPLNPAKVENTLEAHPDAKAVFAVSPNYHGICSDLKRIAEAAHRRSIPLIVDEAHGSHFAFSELLPETALCCGADACAQSLHKTAGALNQSSLLHIHADALSSGRIDPVKIDSALRMTMSTSPSYLLLSSIELAVAELERNGKQLIFKAFELAGRIRDGIKTIGGFSCLAPEPIGLKNVFTADPTRLVINCSGSGISGFELKSRLWKDFSIDVELADLHNVVLIITWGNTEKDAETFIEALKRISEQITGTGKPTPERLQTEPLFPGIPEAALSPREAYYASGDSIEWERACGRISAEAIIPYPPGIPVINPGEVISDEIFRFVGELKKRKTHIHGPADKSLSRIRVLEV